MRLDSARIGAADLDVATRAYALLFSVAPAERADGTRRFQLERGAVELDAGAPGLRSVRFVAEAGDAAPPADFHGLTVEVAPAAPPPEPPADLPAVQAIDHVVVRTLDAERAIALWRNRLGLRLAFDRAFPERGLRLLFFRSGGITFEFATGHPPPAARDEPDVLYGLSYRVADLAAHRERLLAAGVDVSPVRPGNKTGTFVASVRSGTAGVPTLLLEEPGR